MKQSGCIQISSEIKPPMPSPATISETKVMDLRRANIVSLCRRSQVYWITSQGLRIHYCFTRSWRIQDIGNAGTFELQFAENVRNQCGNSSPQVSLGISHRENPAWRGIFQSHCGDPGELLTRELSVNFHDIMDFESITAFLSRYFPLRRSSTKYYKQSVRMLNRSRN